MQRKKKGELHHAFSGLLGNKALFPLATYICIYKEGDIVTIKDMGTVQKGMLHKVTMAKLEESAVLHSMLLALL